MNKQEKSNYFVGLDIGTNSAGYAVTYENYELVKYRQHPVWGVHLFETAKLAEERRTFRAARRRLDRRQQRIQLLRELFSVEISKVDPKFFQRIDASSQKKDFDEIPYSVFADHNYTDKDFYKQYPTIHHLIADLIDSEKAHDVRLVYIACAWLLAHRGHFFSDVSKERIDEITNFSSVYSELENFIDEHGYNLSWKHLDIDCHRIEEILKSSVSRNDKYKQLTKYLQIKKNNRAELAEEQWFDENEFLRLLCGLEIKCSKLFPNSEYEESKLSLNSDDDKIAEILSSISGDDGALILAMKKIFDWSVLADIIGSYQNLSSSKVAIYKEHKKDLKNLKYLVRKYLSHQDYLEIFRNTDKNNYAAYCGRDKRKKISREDFYDFIKGKLKNIYIPDSDDLVIKADKAVLEKINQDIALEKFLPKQVNSDNRTIPYQLYWNELSNILKNASGYLPFLNICDADGLSIKDKILSIMEFRIPYFVGPLNINSKFAWIKRKAEGRILPWNFSEKVDLDASEKEFIRRMTNKCTYLPGEPVLPKNSLLYQKFEVLNMINAIHVKGQPITVECKQKIYKLFFQYSKVSKKTIVSHLISNNLYSEIKPVDITGIDDVVTASLSSRKIFKPLFEAGKLTEVEAEEIICQRSFTEDKKRFCDYLKKYPSLDAEDIKWISSKNLQGFGRLSRKFLTDSYHYDINIGDKVSIINMMWEYNLNLQQLLSDNYSFAKMIAKARKEFYASKSCNLTKQLDEMYVSNAVKRPIIRTLTVLDEITKTMGYAPKKIFVEMARDVDNAGNKGKRTISRMKQIQEYYRKIANDDTRRLSEELKKYDESALQRDVLYLYFMQLGKDMYTGNPITDLALCNKEHIYPQSKVKDDSILNNIVLVNSEDNGIKSDSYPIDAKIRQKMIPFWNFLKDKGLITDEKFYRLTRGTPFSTEEKWGFINRQLVETRQSTKVITELLQERYPDSKIVYVKAGLVSDFRHEFGLIKSRTINDLHHAKDAYLNIVVGNVWHGYFTRQWFDGGEEKYSVNPEIVFGRESIRKNINGTVLWNGKENIPQIKNIMRRNFIHLTNYTFCQHGGLFDQNPLAAAKDLIPLKQGKATEIYGGYRKAAASFFIFALTSEQSGKKVKKELTLVAVDLMIADKFLKDENFAVEYVKNFIDPAGKKNLSVQFPLGLKPIKIKTVFEVDNGLRFVLSRKNSGGSMLGMGITTPLLLSHSWEKYIKRLESFCEKKRKNSNLKYSKEYDKFSCSENIELYDILMDKLRVGIFAKRPNNPLKHLELWRDEFCISEPENQVEVLLNVIDSFGRKGSVVNLSILGKKAPKDAGENRVSSNLSNWKKYFTTARIVYSDASGLHEAKSIDLLKLI